MTGPTAALLVLLAVAAQTGAGTPGAVGAQTIEGRVIDATTGEPIPFVNVGVPLIAVGTVAGDDGRFTLAGVGADTTIVFSAIGYQSRGVPLHSYPQDGEIPLIPVEIGFREQVSVTARASGKPAIFGHQYKARGYGFGFASGLLGAEIGARIRIKHPTYLESANFTIAHTGGERLLYRVNIYDFTKGQVGANLLEQNVIVAAKQERGTLTVDLREQGLIVRNDVLLTLEWIQDDREAGNANVMFRARPHSKANLYHKLTSQMPFQQIPRHSLGFYLVGYSLK